MSTEQSAEQTTKHRRRRKSIEIDPLAGMSEKQRLVFRFGAFDEKRYKYLGLKPGVTADDVNPNWRCEALKIGFAAYAIDMSKHFRQGAPIRRVAEVVAELLIRAAFSKPEIEVTESGHVQLRCGEFWFVSQAEKEELWQELQAALDQPDFGSEPNVLEGLQIGFDLMDEIVVAMRNLQEPSAINYLKKVTIDAIVEQEEFADDPQYHEAIKVLITSDRFSRKRTLTADLSTEASALYSERHDRLRAAAKDYTVHKHRHPTKWVKHVARDDKDRPGKPKIPADLLTQLPFKPERELALEWTAAEMNRRHAELGATANTIRALLRRAKSVIKAEPHVH